MYQVTYVDKAIILVFSIGLLILHSILDTIHDKIRRKLTHDSKRYKTTH